MPSQEEKDGMDPLSVIQKLLADKQQMAKDAAARGDLNKFKSVLEMIKFPKDQITQMEQNGDLQKFMDTCEFLPIKGTNFFSILFCILFIFFLNCLFVLFFFSCVGAIGCY